eukprot:c27096_g1_i1 orf=67-357(+)
MSSVCARACARTMCWSVRMRMCAKYVLIKHLGPVVECYFSLWELCTVSECVHVHVPACTSAEVGMHTYGSGPITEENFLVSSMDAHRSYIHKKFWT